MEIETVAKKWGSSIGIIIPKEVVDSNKIRENDKVIVEIKKRLIARESFGKYPDWERSTQEIKDEARKGWG
jgi:antitoxin component of MazEF toxin-antitoxin module